MDSRCTNPSREVLKALEQQDESARLCDLRKDPERVRLLITQLGIEPPNTDNPTELWGFYTEHLT